MLETGIIFALGALLFWGFGDFLIQRTARKFGDWETLFVISFFGVVILTPFIYNDVFLLKDNTLFLLLGVSITLLLAAILDFEALRRGKLAVVEPVYALEVPVTAIFAFLVVNESFEIFQLALISLIILGLVLISLRTYHFSRKKWLEKGVLLATVGTIFMGASNFLVGFGSRITTPLLTNWFMSVFLSAVSIYYIFSSKRLNKLVNDFRKNKKLILSVSMFDNFAWISFAIAASLIPIAFAMVVSESYIALAALLGFIINKEKLLVHQKLGLCITFSCAAILILSSI